MKTNLSYILRNILFIILYSILLCGVGFLIAYLISLFIKNNFAIILSYVALTTGIVGIIASLKGNPTGLFSPRTGANAQYVAFEQTETTRIERDITNYYQNFTKHSVAEFTLNTFTLLLSAVFMALIVSIIN